MVVLPQAGSTNALLADRARTGAAAGTVLVTEHQTAGRGRLDRTWLTPARACLTFSLLERPDLPARHWPMIPLAVGYAVHTALSASLPELSDRGLGLKWPNDVLVADRKLAGILVERIDTPDGPAAVIGIGLNVSLTDGELPVPTATSLALELGRAPDRTDLLLDLVAALGDAVGMLHQPEHLRAAYAAVCSTVGREVRVELPTGPPLLGRAADIDTDGRLLVDGPGGRVAVGVGDVIHVRSPNV